MSQLNGVDNENQLGWERSSLFIQSNACLLLRQTEVLFSRDNTDGVGVTHTAAPALDADNVVALVDNTELQAVGDGPLETAVDILLPDLDVEVGLALGEEEWPDTTVKVRILGSLLADASDRPEQAGLPLWPLGCETP